MLVPSPATQGANAAVTSATLNSYRDGLNFLLGAAGATNTVPILSIYQSSGLSQTVSGGGSPVAVRFDTEIDDNDNAHNGAVDQTKFSPQTAGRYEILGQVGLPPISSGRTTIELRLNGVRIAACDVPNSSNNFIAQVHCLERALNPATFDYVQLTVIQNTGSGITLSGGDGTTFLQAKWLRS